MLINNDLVNIIIPKAKLENLVYKSIETLETILSNDSIPVQERITIAFQILEMAGISSQFDDLQLSTEDLLAQIQTHSNSVEKDNVKTTLIESLTNILPCKYLQIDNFLSSEEHQQALEIALSNTDKFIGSTTATQEEEYRKSSVLYATYYPEFYNLLKQKIFKVLPKVLSELKHPSFLVSQVEMQMTAHNDGCFYKMHNDSGSPDTYTRELTYVYYFYQEPKQFSGGELKLYDTDLQASYNSSHGKSHLVEPRNNSIVFFNSIYMHEVLPVSCLSRKFEDSRFTLNGWLRRIENS